MTSGEDVAQSSWLLVPNHQFNVSTNVSSRAEIALTDGRLMGVSRELNSTAEEEETLRDRLNEMERELREIERY